jgi:hypothetical protein
MMPPQLRNFNRKGKTMTALTHEATLTRSLVRKPAALGRFAFLLPACLVLFASHEIFAQDKQTVAFTLPAGSIHYIQEQTIEVGDVPGHKLRIFDSRVDYQNINFSIGGVRVKESFTRGSSDYINGNGTSNNYSVYLLEDGNKLFAKDAGVAQTTAAAGAPTFRSAVVVTFTGGTGKFRGIKGQLRGNVVRASGDSVAKADVNGEYWIDE